MKICPNCQTVNRDTAKFCQDCGTTLSTGIICSNCGASNSTSARYCQGCAAPLPLAVPPASAQPAAGMTGRLPPNALVGNRYLILRKLGQGGMGAVYQVCDTRLGNRVCAMKEMSTAALLDPVEKQSAIEAFKQEAHLLSTLSHPNLPRVTDYFSDGEKQFLVMDYVEGQPLDDLISSHSTPFPESQVLGWADQLCEVLSYLHSRTPPIIFRDLKPGNIMISPDGKNARLIDFGIARLFKSGASKDTMALGTPGYAPPEQYGRGQSDPRSDVYALGATLHHAFTLRDPAGEPFKFPSIRAFNPTISTHVDAAILRAVEQDRVSRWQSMADFQKALKKPTPRPAVPSLVSQSAQAPAVAATVVARPIPQPVHFPTTPPASTLPFADNSARIVAMIVDGILISVISVLCMIPLAGIINSSSSSNSTSGLVILVWLGITLLYYTTNHARTGQTPGKRMAKIKVVRRNGDRITFGRALWRTLLFIGLPLLLSVTVIGGLATYLVPFIDKQHRALHDIIADTVVVKS